MNVLKSIVSVGTIACSLPFAGCASKPQVLEAPYDELTFERAIPEPEAPKPVEIVEVPKPLPLPVRPSIAAFRRRSIDLRASGT